MKMMDELNVRQGGCLREDRAAIEAPEASICKEELRRGANCTAHAPPPRVQAGAARMRARGIGVRAGASSPQCLECVASGRARRERASRYSLHGC